jgi:hypothetical protein
MKKGITMASRRGKVISVNRGEVKIIADDTGEILTSSTKKYRQIVDLQEDGTTPIYGTGSQREDTPLRRGLPVVFEVQGANASKVHRFGTSAKLATPMLVMNRAGSKRTRPKGKRPIGRQISSARGGY